MSEPPPAPAPAPSAKRRRPGRLRRWVVRPFVWGLALLALLLMGAYFLVTGSYGRSRVADLVVARTTELLGRRVQVGELDYTFAPLAVELHDVVIPGPRAGDPPVAVVPLVRIQSSWRGLRRKVLELEQIDIVRPRIYFQFNPDGTSNLPSFRTGGGGQGRFETRIGRILVENGELRLNHLRLPLSLDARAIWGRLTGPDPRSLAALVTAQEVVVTLPGARPYPVAVSARGTIRSGEGQVRLSAVRLASPDATAWGSGVIGWRGGDGHQATIDLAIRAEGEARLANDLGYADEPIEGPFRFDGGFHLAGEQWSYAGEVASPRVAVLGRTFEDLAAHLDGGRERLAIDVARARYAGGTAAGRAIVDTDVPESEQDLGVPIAIDATFRDLALERVLADQQTPVEGLTGRLSGTLKYNLRSTAPLAGSGTADVRLAARQGTGGGGALELTGRAPLTIRDGVVSSPDVQLQSPGQRVAASGSVDLEPFDLQLEFRLDTEDVGDLARLLPLEPGPPPPWLPTAGQGRAVGSLRYAREALTVETTFDLRDVAAPALALDSVAGSLRLAPDAIDQLRVTARRGAGTLAVSGRIPLPQNGHLAPGERLALTADAERWPAANLAALVPGAPEMTGELTGRADLGGTFESLAGRAEAHLLRLTVAGYEVGEVEAAVAFDGPRIRVDRGVVRMAAGELVVAGSLDRASGAVDLTADAPALALDREPLRRLLRGTAGEASLALSLQGTLDHPQATLTLHGADLAFNGRPLGQAGGADVLATWDGRSVRASGSLLGLVNFDGGGRLDREGAEVAFAVKSDDLAALARVAAQQALPDFTGNFSGTVSASANFGAGTYGAELRLDRLAATYQGREIANLEPVVVALAPDRLSIKSFYLGEPQHSTELFVNGTVGLTADMPLDLNLQSTVWVGWLGLLLPDYSLSGFFDVIATVHGTLAAPVLNGEGELRDARIILPQLPSAVEDLTGTVFFDRRTVTLQDLRGRVGGGTLRASGTLDLPVGATPFHYQILLAATDLSLRYPEGWLTRGSARVTVSGDTASRQVRGSVDLQRAFYLEDVEVGTLQLLQRVFQRERLEVVSTDDVLASTQLFLTVSGPDALRVRNNVANLAGDIDLVVRGSAARPVVFGRVELSPGGKITYSDNEYEVERGLLTFQNPYRIDPLIDLVARTKIQSFEITLNLSGTIERLDANFSSNANLADLEILSLVATGQELSTGNERELFAPGPGQQQASLGAGGFLAGQAASVLSKRVGTLFGFDRFRINPISGETGDTIGGVGITVGKRLSRDVFVTYSTNPSSTRQNVLQVEWRVADNLTLVLTQSTGGGYAVDARWERRF